MPSETYGKNGVTPIFRSFHRKKLSSCDDCDDHQAFNYEIKNYQHPIILIISTPSWMVTRCCVIFAIVMCVPLASYRSAMIYCVLLTIPIFSNNFLSLINYMYVLI